MKKTEKQNRELKQTQEKIKNNSNVMSSKTKEGKKTTGTKSKEKENGTKAKDIVEETRSTITNIFRRAVEEKSRLEKKQKYQDLISKQKAKHLPRQHKKRKTSSDESDISSSSSERSGSQSENGSESSDESEEVTKQKKPKSSSTKTKVGENMRLANDGDKELEDSAESGPVEPAEVKKVVNNTMENKSPASLKENNAVEDVSMAIDLNEAPDLAEEAKPIAVTSPSKLKRVIVDDDEEDDVSGEVMGVKSASKKSLFTDESAKTDEGKSPKNKEKNSKKIKEKKQPRKELERLKSKAKAREFKETDDSEEEDESGEEYEVEKIISHRYVKVSIYMFRSNIT